MSLEQAAKHLAAHGRGKDTALVHMTPSEVQSLQTLAMANGGSLSINPHTGLPEAGFLSSMLPMIAGAALVAATGGAAAPAVLGGMSMPMAAGLGIGALQTARTGSLQKGLMAGLGAYGGAGLAGGLMGAGAQQMAGETLAKEGIAAGESVPANFAETAGRTATPAQIQTAMQNTPRADLLSKGIGSLGQSGGFTNLGNAMTASGGPGLGRAAISAATPMLLGGERQQQAPAGDSTMPQRLQYNVGRAKDAQGNTFTPMPDVPGYDDLGRDFGRPQSYFPNAGYQQITQEEAKKMRGYAGGGPVEDMSNANAVGANTGYPMADINKATYATPYQTPISQNVVQGTADTGVNSMTGEMNEFANGGLSSAASHLGDYSDGGRLLKGPGDGVSDSIPATIGNKRPARLADGEFVVPARIVSELGNGSTEAGARKLYAMLDRVQAARKKSIGKGKVAHNSRADKLLPA